MFFKLPPDFFIKESIANLEKNILNMSQEQLNDQLKEIYKLTERDFFEIAILNKFLKRIKRKKEYYYHKQYPSRNWQTLLYKILHLWHNPNYQNYIQYYEKYSFIEKKLQNRLNNLHKKYATKK
jgi:hypothetical protein